jgi:cytochrome P450
MAATADIRRFPGPAAPAIAQVLDWGTRQFDFWNRNARAYGSPFRVRWPFLYEGKIVAFATPSAAQQILKLPPTVAHAGEAYQLLQLTAGPNAVIVLDEDEHLRLRKLVLSPLHGKRLARWESFARDLTLDELSTWPVGTPFALRPVTERISMAVIMKIVFGVRDPARAEEMGRLAGSFGDVSVAVGLTAFTDRAKIDLGPRSPYGRFRRRLDRFDALIHAEIAERRREHAQAAPDAEPSGDLMSMLLEARDDDGRPMTDDELRDQLVTMLSAGHETTATSIAWAFERLTRNPAVLAKLVASVDAGETEYLDAVIKETLRIRPVVAQIGRVTTEETMIDGWAVPARTMVIVPMSVIHQDSAIYPDPEVFRPERFLDGNDPGGYSWLPFGGGVRRCPGASLALLEMRVVLATVLRHLELAPDRIRDERPRVRGITIAPARGGRIVVTRRRAA